MNLKKCVLLFVVFAMCISFCILPTGVSAAEKISEDVLYGLGIVPAENNDSSRLITRADAARYAVGMLGKTDCMPLDTPFEDVKADNEYSGFIGVALDNGIISQSEYFRPDDKILCSEFIKMLIETLDYRNLALSQGGYPTGYIFAAESLGILDGIIIGSEDFVSFSDASKLLANALNSPVLGEVVMLDNEGKFVFAYENARKTETFLYKKMNIRSFNVFVEDMSVKKGKATVTLISEKTKSDDKDYIIGDKYSFILSEKGNFTDFSHTYAKMWIDENEEIICMELGDDTEIKYAYIDEINKSDVFGELSEVREINNVALVGAEDYIDTAENCKFYFDGKEIAAGAVPYIGSFARVVIYKDEIVSMEGFTLKEGGIITNVDNGLISYKNDKWDNKEFRAHATSEEYQVILNGEPGNYWGIVPDMLFDYVELDNKIIFVVSSRSVTDNFDGIMNDSLIFGGEPYKKSEAFKVNYSEDGVSYIADMTADDILGELATAYLDLSGQVRFVTKPVFNEDTAEFYGFVLGYEEDAFSEEAKFKINRIYNDRVEERILGVTKTVKKTPEFEAMKNSALSLYSGGTLSENLVANNDILWKIRAVNGKIVSLKPAENFDQSPKEGGITSVTYIPGGTVPYISSPRIFFEDAIICALFYDDYLGKVSARILTHADIRDKTFSGVRMDFYSQSNGSEIDIALFRGDVKTIATNRADLINLGVMKFENYTQGKDGNSAATVKMLNDATYIVPEKSVKDAGKYSIVKYAENVAIFDESPINVVEIIASLDGNPYSWDAMKTSTSSTAPDGFYTDVVVKCDGKRVFLDTLANESDSSSNVRYYLNVLSDYYVYRITNNPENRFETVSINEIEPGMRIWYGLRNQFVSFIIVE